MTEKAPHRPAAFINAIAEEGDKAEAVKALQETWDDYCEATDAARRWYAAASPYATPEALKEALAARAEVAPTILPGKYYIQIGGGQPMEITKEPYEYVFGKLAAPSPQEPSIDVQNRALEHAALIAEREPGHEEIARSIRTLKQTPPQGDR